MTRKIVHIDCDSFYASIETRDNPALADLPVAVGGAPERRGVVATCNYLARGYGVHSAMASSTARRLCPDLVIIKPDIDRYRKVSTQIHRIFAEYTTLIEPLSLDEAYLDLTGSLHHGGDPGRIAAEIRERIAREIGITVSAGIAPNKFLAKIASDWNKPNGQFVIQPEAVDDFVRQLPVQKLFGVGKVTAGRLNRMGINTCADLRQLDRVQLDREFGSFGKRLFELCRGEDSRPVQTSRVRKSVSVENTFVRDLPDFSACAGALPQLQEQLLTRLDALQNRYRITRQFIKIKFNDFTLTTVESQSEEPRPERYLQLLQEGFQRQGRPVRLLGIGVGLAPAGPTARAHSTLPEPAGERVAGKEKQLGLFQDSDTA